jgi:type IV secretion system protein VirB11
LVALRDAGDWPAFFKIAVAARKNILVSGATGSGKTTLAKALIQLIPPNERLLTIEDTRELIVPHRNVVHMVYSSEGQGRAKVGPKQLLESALRMRDRILLQELRDGTAFFYLRNVNSGHPGSITTVHAGSAAGAFEQLTLLVKESEGGRDLAAMISADFCACSSMWSSRPGAMAVALRSKRSTSTKVGDAGAA